MVLRSAGYSVEVCPSLLNLHSVLQSAEKPDAVIMSDLQPIGRHDAITLVRTQSSASLILFQHADYTPDESDFDLVIPNLTPVKEWLEQIAALIESSRAPHASAQSTRKQSAELRQESNAARENSAEERQRSSRVHAKAERVHGTVPDTPSSGSKAS